MKEVFINRKLDWWQNLWLCRNWTGKDSWI